MQNVNRVPSRLSVTLAVLAGTGEYLGNLKRGRNWWLGMLDSSDARKPSGFVDFPEGVFLPGHKPGEVELELPREGWYVLGCGNATRIRFQVSASANGGRVEVDGRMGTATVSGPVPSPGPSVADQPDPWHVHGAPVGAACYGVTYPTGRAAVDAIGPCIKAGTIDPGLVASGLVKPMRGPWPSAAPAPSVAPVTQPEPARRARAELDADAQTAAWLRLMGEEEDDTDPDTAPPEMATPVPRGWDVIDGGVDWSPETGDRYDTPLTLPTDPAPAPAPEPKPAPKGEGMTWTAAPHERTQESVDRFYADERHFNRYGMRVPPPVVELGGAVNGTGRANLRKSRQNFDKLPLAGSNCEAIVDAVRREAREDRQSLRANLEMTEDGRLRGYHLEETGLKSAASLFNDTLPGAARVLAVMDPALRARVWNEQTARSEHLDDSCVLRTRSFEGGPRSIYAVVSDGYTPCDADIVARHASAAIRQLPGADEARGLAHYDPETTQLSIDVLWHVDRVQNFGAGDVFKVGARIRSADNGGGAVRVEFCAWRNLCYNLIVLGQGRVNLERIVHRGEERDIIRRLRDGIRRVSGAVEPFLERWGVVRKTPVASTIEAPSEDSVQNTLAVIRAITRQVPAQDLPVAAVKVPKDVDWAGINRDVLVEEMLASWKDEPGDSLADVLNAVTRLHTREKVPVNVVRQAEVNAGLLLQAWT